MADFEVFRIQKLQISFNIHLGGSKKKNFITYPPNLLLLGENIIVQFFQIKKKILTEVLWGFKNP